MNRVFFTVLLLALVTGSAWLLSQREVVSERDVRGDTAHRDDASGRPHLVVGTSEALREGNGVSAPTGEDSAPVESAEVSDAVSLTLVGHLVGWDRTLPGALSVRVARVDGGSAETLSCAPKDFTVSDDLHFSVDVSDQITPGPGELAVTIDHPAYVPHIVRRHSGEAAGGQLVVEVALQRAAGIRGRVEDETGRPIGDATVGVFRMRDGEPERKAIGTTQSAADGSFLVRVGSRDRFLLAAHAPHRQLAIAEIEVTPATAVNLRPLVLRAGYAIEGTVRNHGEPLAKAVIDLAFNDEELVLTLGTQRLAWFDGQLYPYYLQVHSGADGRYAFRGLPEATYTIGVSGGDALVLHTRDVRDGKGRKVRPPTTNVDFDVDALRLVAQFQCDGVPLPGLEVWLNTLHEQPGLPEGDFGVFDYYPTTTDDEGRVEVGVSLNRRYSFGVSSPAYESMTAHFLTPKAGRGHAHVIEVKRKSQGPVLNVRLVGPGATDIERSGFALYAAEQDTTQVTPGSIRSVDGQAGKFALESLPPGRWILHTRPGRDWYIGFSYYLESRQVIDVPLAGTTEIEVALHVGGALRIAAKDANGRLLGPECKLLDAQGEDVGAKFTVRSEAGVTINASRLIEGAPNRVLQVLAPGTYSLQFTDRAYHQKEVAIRIQAGQTTQVETVLAAIR